MFAPRSADPRRFGSRLLPAVWALWGGLLLGVAAPALDAAEPRYQAWLVDGRKVGGPEILDWHEADKPPRFEGTPLFDPANPVRWLRDTSVDVGALPAARVEFHGGDILGGVVTGLATPDTAWWKQPAAVWFEPLAKLHWPDQPRSRNLMRVQTRWLKKVVWQPREDTRLRPGTAFLRDGRQFEFRAVRWGEASVRLLVEQEQRELPISDLAELHLPRQDGWNAWWEQLATLAPAFDNTLSVWQLETTDGNRLTTSSTRFRPLSRGGNNPDHWYHAIQPAWSLDPLFVSYRAIGVRRFFRPHEVPLSALEPTRLVQRSALGQVGPPRVDRNVQAGFLRCGDDWYGWGLGVHAHTEATFEIPRLAGTFRTGFALDRAAGTGGCVRPEVRWEPADGSLTADKSAAFRAAPIVGSGPPTDTGPLPLPTAVAGTRLTLVADSVVSGAPPGADPLEIRDLANWVQPLFELDPPAVEREIRSRQGASLAAWEGWTLTQADGRPVGAAAGDATAPVWPISVRNVWDTADNRGWRFRTEVSPIPESAKPGEKQAGLFVLTNRLSVPRTARYLAIAASRFEKETQPSRLQVSIDGVAAAEFEVPIRYGWQEAGALLVPVEAWAGKSVAVEIAQFADDVRSVVEWRTIQFTDRDPSVLVLFEDDPGFVAALEEGTGLALFDSQEKFAGAGSLQLTAGERGRARLDRVRIPIRGTPRLGEFRVMAFAWKKATGAIGLHFARDGEFSTEETREARNSLRYAAGTGGRFASAGNHRLDDKPPAEWKRITRDLYGDFGELDLSGIRFEAAGDGPAWFDHIVFGRTNEDVARLDPKRHQRQSPLAGASDEVKKNTLDATHEPEQFTALVSRVAPRFSTLQAGNGLWLLKQHGGRGGPILKTHPPDRDKPLVLRGDVSIPLGASPRLRLTVSHEKDADWQLQVFAAGESIHDQLIGGDLTKETGGWAEITVDLGRFAGRTILLEVHQKSNNWSNEWGYWQRVVIE